MVSMIDVGYPNADHIADIGYYSTTALVLNDPFFWAIVALVAGPVREFGATGSVSSENGADVSRSLSLHAGGEFARG
jgi:hypothetical protein